jgi:hypothetical protein
MTSFDNVVFSRYRLKSCVSFFSLGKLGRSRAAPLRSIASWRSSLSGKAE